MAPKISEKNEEKHVKTKQFRFAQREFWSRGCGIRQIRRVEERNQEQNRKLEFASFLAKSSETTFLLGMNFGVEDYFSKKIMKAAHLNNLQCSSKLKMIF